MINKEIYFKTMIDFVIEAGEIALSFIDQKKSMLKKDASILTEADLKISALAHQRLKVFLEDERHVLIEEEDTEKEKFLNQDFLNKKTFIWSVDPIDGTRGYANRMPYYGISIGLIKDLKPWLGVVYFPSLKELFYCDGENAFFVKEAFSLKEKKEKIVPIDEDISSRSVLMSTDDLVETFSWVKKECHLMMTATAVCELCWPSIGRGCGSLFRGCLWDMAGSWPIFEKAGLKLRSFLTGQSIDYLDVKLFMTQEDGYLWKLKDYYILASKKNDQEFRRLIKKKD